jgi:hypothetical protein
MVRLAQDLKVPRTSDELKKLPKPQLENLLRAAAGLPTLAIEAHHPFNAQIHNTLQPLAGAYPAYYNVLHTKQDMTAEAPYAGNLLATYRKYCAFAGLPQVPATIPPRPPTKSIEAEPAKLFPAPIECGSCSKGQDKKKERSNRYHVEADLVECCSSTGGAPGRKGTNRKPRTTKSVRSEIAPAPAKKLPEFGDIFK